MPPLSVTKAPKRGSVKTTRYLCKGEERRWVKELGVNKIIYRTNRILRKWGVNCPITIITLPYPKVDFILEETYFYAIGVIGIEEVEEEPYSHATGIKDTNKYLAYVSLQRQTIICQVGSFVYIFSLPSASWFVGCSKIGGSLIQHPPLNLSLPLVLAAKALVARVPDLYGGWVGFCGCWRHDPQNCIAVVILKNHEGPSITILFGRWGAECKVDLRGREIYHFVGRHSQAVAEALKIIALSSL